MVGGFDGTTPTNTAEMFCPISRKWTSLLSMRLPRSGVKAVAINGLLYVVGGWDGRQRLSSGEVFNPEFWNWEELPYMRIARSNYSAVATPQGQLLVMGGYQGQDTTSNVEILDMEEVKWIQLKGLPRKRSATTSKVIQYRDLDEAARDRMRAVMHEDDRDLCDIDVSDTDETTDSESDESLD